jgi:hypothetical protein
VVLVEPGHDQGGAGQQFGLRVQFAQRRVEGVQFVPEGLPVEPPQLALLAL